MILAAMPPCPELTSPPLGGPSQPLPLTHARVADRIRTGCRMPAMAILNYAWRKMHESLPARLKWAGSRRGNRKCSGSLTTLQIAFFQR